MTAYSQKLEAKIQGRKELIELLTKKKDAIDAEYITEESNATVLEEALSLAKKCLQESIEKRSYIEDIVSDGLSIVYGTPYEFKLEVVEDNGIIKGLKPRMRASGGEFEDPMDSFGGGGQSVASLLLKLAALILTPNMSRVFVADEPTANLTPLYWGRLMEYLQGLCEGANMQMILITHAEPGGKIFWVQKKDGVNSTATEVAAHEWKTYRNRLMED